MVRYAAAAGDRRSLAWLRRMRTTTSIEQLKTIDGMWSEVCRTKSDWTDVSLRAAESTRFIFFICLLFHESEKLC